MRVIQTVVAVALATAGAVAEAHLPVLQQDHANAVAAQKFASNSGNQSPATGYSNNVKAAVAPAAAPVPERASSSSSTSATTASSSTSAPSKPSTAAKAADSSPKKDTPATPATPAKPAAPVSKAAAPQTPPKADKPKKSIIDKAADVTKLVFGKVERQRQRKEKKPDAQYLRKQKSAAEIKVDATGTKQPASLSDPKVNIMEAMSDLVKRYAGQKSPDKAQLQEDLKTVFESRAEKGDLTTKQFRQGYKVKELKPNGVGKRSPKSKRDLEARDLDDTEIEIAARDAEAEEELDIEARDAEAEDEFEIEAREAEADPEAMVYEEEADLFTRDSEDDDSAFAIRDEQEEGSSRSKSHNDDESEDRSPAKSDKDDESEEDQDDLKSKKAALKKAIKKKLAAKKLALKKKLAAKKLAMKKKQRAAKKRIAAQRKAAAAARKAHQKSASFDDDDEEEESDNVIIVGGDAGDNIFSTSRFSKSKSRASKNKKGAMAKLRAALRAAKQRAAEEDHDDFFTPIPPTREERPFYRAPGDSFFEKPMEMNFPAWFNAPMAGM